MGILPAEKRAERIKIAENRGMKSVPAIADASVAANISLHIALALAQKETGGENCYGHDLGGVFSTKNGPRTIFGVTYPAGSRIPVTAQNYLLFLSLVMNGSLSNGVGPYQLTYAGEVKNGHRDGGHFTAMAARGLRPWVPVESSTYALGVFKGYLEQYGDLRTAGAHYNGGTHPDAKAWQYGTDLVSYDNLWKQSFGL